MWSNTDKWLTRKMWSNTDEGQLERCDQIQSSTRMMSSNTDKDQLNRCDKYR